MRAFDWDRVFATGLETIDRQNRHLVDLINRLGDTLVDGQAGHTEVLDGLFRELTDYADQHFAEEERLMDRAAVDARHVARHRQSHLRFIEQISSMWDSRTTIGSPAAVLHEFLAAWLSFHILGEDQAMARQIKRIAGGASAAEAYELEDAPSDSATSALLRALGNLYHALSEQRSALARANQLLEQRVAERTQALARANSLLEKASRTDGLLGIANRMSFDETLEREWRRAVREQAPLALLMIDVDRFKCYNDAYGHQAGDACLRAVARAVAEVLRRPSDLLARYGGDELVVMLPNTGADGARTLAHSIHEAIAHQRLAHRASGVSDRVTVSVGVAAAVADVDTAPASLVAAADQALYAAKGAGRNRVAG